MSRILTPPFSRSRRRYSARPFYWCLVAFVTLVTLRWLSPSASEPHSLQVLKRDDHQPLECRLVRNANDKCAFVRTYCPDHEDGLFSYLQLYYCSFADAKPVAFIIILLWLSLLFSTIGIAASDFLCIDLSTLASVLGLSESLTGVTFLAFGNGSPDVFSTFAAMRSNSGSLAIGELLGAAGFITSVVAGSMALIRPFKVARRSFVRDIGYFIVAVSFSMFLVADGRIHVWEAASMVGLYCFYVVLVVSWHWYMVRRRRVHERDFAARSHFHIPVNQELDIEEEEEDDPGVASESTSLLPTVSVADFDTLERAGQPAWEDGEEDETRNRYLAEIRDNMHIHRPSSHRRNTLNPIRPSLVGALEFQSVLSSLQKSRSIHQNINLERYSDSDNMDAMSAASHPRVNSPSSRLSPDSGVGSSRNRAVSANDAIGLRIDTNLFDTSYAPPRVTVSRPSDSTAQQGPSAGQPVMSRLSPPPPNEHPPGGPSPDLLAPPADFHAPNYQAPTPQLRSPLDVSPRGTSVVPGDESPVSPFPPFPDAPSTSSRAPSIRLPAPSSELLQAHENRLGPWWSSPLRSFLTVLFPTLAGWKAKNFWERLLGIVVAPSVLLLTLTVPVIEPGGQDATQDPVPVVVTSMDGESPAPPVRLPDDSPLLRPHDGTWENANQNGKRHQDRPRLDSELPPPVAQLSSKEWSRWLIVIQLFAGPFFVALISWTAMDPDLHARSLLLPSLISLLVSLICLSGFVVSTRHNQSLQTVRPFLAFLGFIVAISWIATIATEVVSLLKTLGVIIDISDSLLGLTVFAVGNSLGDLVADITVARLGYPVMALSACFGGPMLNILLGIGLGGLYMTLNVKPEIVAVRGAMYELTISKVLIISAITLLATLVGLLVVVPLNKWEMDRKIGWGLVILWCVSTMSNVIAELVT